MGNYAKILVYILVFSFSISTSIFWTFERGVNPTIRNFWDAAWWWFITSSTVGYGDISPVTSQGRIASVITVLLGMYVYTNFVTTTADIVREKLDKNKKGKVQLDCKNHIVICEYTAFADELIQEINNYPYLKNKEIVNVTSLVENNPYPKYKFVFGVPISPDSLKKANIELADYIFVFSNIRFGNPDLKTLHIVQRLQKLNNKATIFVELVNKDSYYLQYIKKHENKIVIIETDKMLENLISKNTLDLDSFINA